MVPKDEMTEIVRENRSEWVDVDLHLRLSFHFFFSSFRKGEFAAAASTTTRLSTLSERGLLKITVTERDDCS